MGGRGGRERGSLWNISLHCDWFNKDAEWPTVGRIMSEGDPHRERWEEEGSSQRSSEQTQKEAGQSLVAKGR